jgi:hypothetical protein
MFWQYINDNCDHAGIWEVDFDLASYQLGVELDEDEVKRIFSDKIAVLHSGEQWYLKDFCGFQYGKLMPQVPCHESAQKILRKHCLLAEDGQPLAKPYVRAKDKDKAKDTVRDEDTNQDTDQESVLASLSPVHRCRKHDIEHTEAFCPQCCEEL